jgi:hypothetical protein
MHLEALVNNVGGVLIVTLAKKEGYQKQLCIIPPRIQIPSHNHKNVRTNIIFLEGFAVFIKSGKSIELVSPQDACRSFIIDPGEEHAAYTLDRHCIFISEQYWLENEPVRSLHLQWTGDPINQEHEKQLNARVS